MADKAPQTYSSLDLELIPILSRMDPIFGNIIRGVRTTLNTADNPDKLYQAANSIRGFTNLLIRNARYKLKNDSSKKTLNKKQIDVLEKLSNSFDRTLQHLPDELEEKKVYKNYLNDQFYSLNKDIEKAFQCVPITTRHILRSYFGDQDDVNALPEPMKERIKRAIVLWHKNHDYFVKVCHYSDGVVIEMSDFLSKWEDIQRCLLRVLKQFFESADTLDRILQLDEPPNE